MDKVSTSWNYWLFIRSLGVLFVLSGGCFFLSAPAFANTYCVDDTSDPGAGVAGDCAATCDGSNDCALRDAVAAANANNGADTITFAAGAQTHNITATLTLSDATGGTTINGGASGPTVSHDVAINGTGTAGINCFTITSASNTIKGLTIQDCNNGVYINNASVTGTKIQNNYIGTNSAGAAAVANSNGVAIINSGSNNITGTDGDGVNDASEGNVLSGNANYGVIFVGGANNTIAGNYIGITAAGDAALANGSYSVYVSAASNIIGTNGNGTSDSLERNVIAGSAANSGVLIRSSSATGNRIAGNYLGINAAGTAAIAGSPTGIIIDQTATGNYVGTNGDNSAGEASEGNVISGNTGYGLVLNANSNTVAGNIIGLNPAGTAAMANKSGINLAGSSNTIGTDGNGTSDSLERNVISGNTEYGIYLSGSYSGNVIAGNHVGTGSDGTTDLGNTRYGIYLAGGGANNTIGGNIAGESNVIAYNGDATYQNGVYLTGAATDGNQILRNSFFGNYDIGIKLAGDGANNNQSAPSITSRTITGGNIVLNGTSTASAAVQIFEADSDNQEGKNYAGQATADGSGNWTFTLSSPWDENGKKFVATATDGTNGTSQFSSSYTLGNNAPVASAQTVTPNEDTNVTITLGLTDADGGDTTTAEIVTLPAGGTLYQTADGTTLGSAITSVPATVTDSSKRVIYVPSANTNGNGAGNFTFRGSDGLNTSNTATVTINITAVNDPPTAVAQSLTLNEGAPLGIALSGTDVDGNSLTYVIYPTAMPGHGSLSGLNASTGAVIYTPTTGYTGTDSFSFKVYDGTAYSAAAVVSLTIVHVNHAPTASARAAGTTKNGAVRVTFSASDSDGDTLTYSIASNPGHGTLSGLSASAGTVTYTPAVGYSGTDTFTYKANDGTADSNTAVVTVTVDAGSANNAPSVFAGSDLVAVEGSPVALIGSATDEDGDTLTYQWTQGAGISVSLTNADRARSSFTAPTPDGSGDLEFVLTVSDGTDTVTDSVRVRVSRRNFTMESAVKLTGRVVAASAGMAITSEEGVRYDGHEATAVDLGNGSVLYSTDSTPVEVATLGDRVVVGDSAYNDNTGVVVMIDTASLNRGAEIDLNDPGFVRTTGVIAAYGDQIGDLFGYVIRMADIDGDGSREILSLAPGTSNGTLYVLNGDDLETRNMVLGSEAEGLKSSLIFTTDLNGEGSEDMLIGLPSSAIADLTSADGALLASVSSSAAVLGGILGGDDLPTVIDLAVVSTDFVVTASADVSSADGGDLDASGSEDIVMSASGELSVEVIFGSSSVGTDVATLSSGNRLTTDDASLGSPGSMGVDDVTGDGFADIVLGFSTSDGGNGKILVVPGRGNWDADAYDLDNAITVNGADGDGIGEWLILEDYDGDGVVDIYTNEGSDGSYLITLGKLIDEASGGGTGNEADGEGGSGLGPGGFSGCSLDDHNLRGGEGGVMVLFVGLFAGLSLFLLPLSPSTSKSPLTPLFQRGGKEIVLLSLFLSLSTCGGSSGESGTPTDEGGSGGTAPAEEKTYVTLTGRITSPTVSTSISALEDQIPPSPPFVKGGRGGILSKESFVTDGSSAGVRCSLYDLNGDYLGAVTTNETGDFVTTVGLSATEEDPTGRVVVSCENGIENYAEAGLTEADIAAGSTDVNVGISDVSSTLATVSLITDFEEWGDDYSAEVSGRDLGCLFTVNRAVWDEAADSEGGLSDDNAVIAEVVEGFLAAGGQPEDVGYDDWPTLLHDVINEEAPCEMLVDKTSAAGIDVEEYAGRCFDAVEVFQTLNGTFSEQIDALYEEAGTTGDTTTSEVCGDIKDGDIDPAAFVAPILAAETTSEAISVYNSPDGMLLHFNLLKHCKEEGTCAMMKEKPDAFLGFMAGFSGDYSSVFTGGTPGTDTVEGMFRVAENCTGVSVGDIRTCAEGLQERVWVNGWSAFKDPSGQFNSAMFVWEGRETGLSFESVGGALYVYSPVGKTTAEFQRIAEAPNMRYVLIQVNDTIAQSPADMDNLRTKLEMLREHGKKALIGFWFMDWEIFGLANLALNSSVRNAFFDHRVKPVIDGLGAGNIYGLYLLEENGLNHGTDAQYNPACGSLNDFSYESWSACRACKATTAFAACENNCKAQYATTPSSCAGYSFNVPANTDGFTQYADCIDSCTDSSCNSACPPAVRPLADGLNFRGHVDCYPYYLPLVSTSYLRQDYLENCNVKRHEDDFTAFTASAGIPDGCTFAEAQAGEGGCHEGLIGYWIAQRLFAKADIEFAQKMHENYPGIKIFSFPDPQREDIHLLARKVDGFIIDPYGYEFAYRVGRQVRLLAPDTEMIYTGGIPLDRPAKPKWNYSPAERRSLAAIGVLMGADGVGLFGDEPWRDSAFAANPATWNDWTGVTQALERVPVQTPINRVLLVSRSDQGIWSNEHNLDFFKTFDWISIPQNMSATVSPFDYVKGNLSQYDMVIFYYPSYDIEAVGGGGYLPATGDRKTWDCDYFHQTYPNLPCQLDEDVIDAYVNDGGIFVFIAGWPMLGNAYPSFTKDYVVGIRNSYYMNNSAELKLTPSAWAHDNLGVEVGDYYTMARYKGYLAGTLINQVRPLGVQADQWDYGGGLYYDRGGGGVAVFPVFLHSSEAPCVDNPACTHTYPYTSPTGYEYYPDSHGYRAAFHIYLREMLRGIALYKGKDELADLFVEDTPNDTSRHDGSITCADGTTGRALSLSYRELLPVPTTGTDIFTGQNNITFDSSIGGAILQCR